MGRNLSVDDAPTVIYPVDELFQGVAVPPGRHVIRWRFVSPVISTNRTRIFVNGVKPTVRAEEPPVFGGVSKHAGC